MKYYLLLASVLVVCVYLAWSKIHKENIYMNCIHEAHGQGTCAYLVEVAGK